METGAAIGRAASPERTLRALEAVGRRMRRVGAARAVAGAGLVLAAFMAGSFAADYALRLPRGMRVLVLLAALVALAAVAVRRLLPALRGGRASEEVARAVERAQPELEQVVISAIQLARPDSLAARYVSGELVGEVVRRAEARAGAIAPSRAVPARRAGLAGAGALGALAVLALGAWLRPDLARIWLARDVALAVDPWPKRTRIALRSPAGPRVRIARGDDLPVVVEVLKGTPEAVEIRANFPTGIERESMERLGRSTYRKVYANVTASFAFRVEADDDRTEWIRVEAMVRPRIESIVLFCRYPDYMGIPPTDPADPIRHGHIKTPVGTEVAWRARANLPLASARFRFYRSARDRAEIDEPLEIEKEREIAGRFTVRTSGAYAFALRSASGFENPDPIRFRVDAIPDAPPEIRITEPGMNEEVTSRARIDVKARLADDHGVASCRLAWEIPPREGAGAPRTGGFAFPGFQAGRKAVEVGRPFDVGELGVAAGAVIRYRVEAGDLGGNEARSEVYRLTVVEPEELYRLMQDLLVQVKEDLKDVGRLQDRVLRDVRELFRGTAGRPRLTEADAGALVRARIDQKKVSGRLERAARSLGRVLSTMRANRVGEVAELGWIQGIRSEVGALGGERSPEIERRLAELRERIPSASVPPSDVQAVAAAQTELRDDIRDLVDRLEGWGDINAVLRKLRDLISIERVVRQGTQRLLGR